jgi:hypothetical protein
MTQVDSLTWPGTVPLGWSVEWESSPVMTLRSNAMPWAEYGAYLGDVCSRVVINLKF